MNLIELHGDLALLREREIQLISNIALSLKDLRDDADVDYQRLMEVAQDLREMFFMVVVIGEFNSGKSTFVNALLGEELLPMGITPTTEYIELIRYNETANRKPEVKHSTIREWAHPNTGAEGVAIVDTPGTGSVFTKHEAIAKDFLHRSDLVIFVISAKRAFADTERLYLQLAKDYGKKIILVMNQIDLLEPSELSQVRRFIEGQVKETLNISPLLFPVSAKQALTNGKTTNDSGIPAVKAHLRGVYSDESLARQKLLSQITTTEHVLSKHLEIARQKADLVSQDITKVQTVQDELQIQSQGLESRMREASANLDVILEGVRQRGVKFIEQNLNIRRIGRGSSREKLQTEFQEVVIGRSLRDINESTEEYINAVVDQSRLYWRHVIDRLNQLKDLMEQEVTGLDSSIYAEQRTSLQEAIRLAESELKSYATGQVVTDMQDVFRANMTGFQTSLFASIGGLIVAILGVAAPGPLIGAAGGVVAAPLALPAVIIGAPIAAIGGVAAIRYFRRVQNDTKRGFHQKVDELLATYHKALDDLTSRERNRLLEYGSQTLLPIFSRLETLAQTYADQRDTLNGHQKELEDLQAKIKQA